MKRVCTWLTGTPGRVGVLVAVVYVLSSFLSSSMKEYGRPPDGSPRWYYGEGAYGLVSLPRILRGDEMHYLLMANSLALDGDLELSRDYTSVLQGGLEMGVYHRGRPAKNFIQHFTRRADGTLVGKHPFGFSAILASLLWPLAGTAWMEAGTIWLTALMGALGIWLVMKVLESLRVNYSTARNIALLTAFATPWWSYSRTLYTEVWIGTGLLALLAASLRNRTVAALPFAVLLAWFKYPALLLFFSAGIADLFQRRRAMFVTCGLAGAVTLAGIMAFNSRFFENTSWYTRVEASPAEVRQAAGVTAVRAGGAPIGWIPGKVASNIRRVFLDDDKGLMFPTPLLLLGLAGLAAGWRADRRSTLILLAFIVPWAGVHISYRWLMAGASYTTRYLVPLVPLLMIPLAWYRQRWAGHKALYLFRTTAVLSLATNTVAGLFPAASFDKNPLEIWINGVKIAWCAFFQHP